MKGRATATWTSDPLLWNRPKGNFLKRAAERKAHRRSKACWKSLEHRSPTTTLFLSCRNLEKKQINMLKKPIHGSSDHSTLPQRSDSAWFSDGPSSDEATPQHPSYSMILLPTGDGIFLSYSRRPRETTGFQLYFLRKRKRLDWLWCQGPVRESQTDEAMAYPAQF